MSGFNWSRFLLASLCWFIAMIWISTICVLMVLTFFPWDAIFWNVIDGFMCLVMIATGAALLTEL